MSKKSFCIGHHSDFQHLESPLNEHEWDIGYCFEEKESDEFSVNPNNGIKVWAEPYLVLYISVVHKDSQDKRQTLHYGLTRSKFSNGSTSTKKDRDRLLELTLPHVKSDLELLKRRIALDNLKKPKML